MNEQWKNLKDTIVEIRDNNKFENEDVTFTCRFLVNYMEVLEKQMQEPCEDVARERYEDLYKVVKNMPPVVLQPKMGCEGCTYEKTGNNSTYPCSHCSRCYTDKYKVERNGEE